MIRVAITSAANSSRSVNSTRRASDNGRAQTVTNSHVDDLSFARSRRSVGSRAMSSTPTTALVRRGLQQQYSVTTPLTIARGRRHTGDTILRAWLEGKGDHTRRAYQRDLEAFAL